MTILEDSLAVLIDGLDDTSVGKAVFYWGTSEDLPQFITAYGKNSIPLVWLVSDYDKPSEDGWYREAELVLCTSETRTDLLNIDRIKDNYSYKTVLFPLWESLKKAINISGNLWIDDEPSFLKSPNHSVSGEHEAKDIWDVLKIKVRINFNEDYAC